jgi:RNA polymerase sigma-70 factor (family 1)
LIRLHHTDVFDQVYKTYYHRLCFYASRFIKADYAEDVIETLFLKLWNKKQVFETEEHMKAFLYHAVRNACLDHIKVSRNAAVRHNTYTEIQARQDPDPLHHLIEAEALAAIYQAIEALPAQCAKVIRMSFLEGRDNAAIASEMNLSLQTVKNYKTSGLSFLKTKLSMNALSIIALLALLD